MSKSNERPLPQVGGPGDALVPAKISASALHTFAESLRSDGYRYCRSDAFACREEAPAPSVSKSTHSESFASRFKFPPRNTAHLFHLVLWEKRPARHVASLCDSWYVTFEVEEFMMGPEIVIALGALALALAAIVRQNAHATRSQAAATQLQQEGQERAQTWKQRFEELAAEASGRGPADPESAKRLSTQLKMLELRLAEHDQLLSALVTEDEARHLWNVGKPDQAPYELHSSVEEELRHLVRRGLLKKTGDFRIHELPRQFQLCEHFEITDAGQLLLALRKHLKETDTRKADSLPPRSRASDVHFSTPADAPAPFEDDGTFQNSTN